MVNHMSLINVDLKGLSEPATKLIEKVSSAIGVLYEPRQIRKKAQAEADAKKITSLANIEISDLEARALERTIKSAARKQENIESITMQAALQMNEADSNVAENLNEDWIVHFFDQCENISDKDMQTIWAKILSGEAKSKGSYSKRTINFLSSLDKQDAELITAFGQFVWMAAVPTPIFQDEPSNIIEKYGMTFPDLVHLESIGVITTGLGYSLNFSGKLGRINYFGTPLYISFENLGPEEKKVVQTGTILLTTIGTQIMPLCGAKPNKDYFNNCIKHWEGHEKLRFSLDINSFRKA